jgi:hypothetical protein
MRGTAFLVRDGIQLEHVEKLPSGRAIAAVYRGMLLVNVYAPSGTSRRAEREAFYNLELAALLRNEVAHVVLGGDFNCVLQPSDVTGQYTRSRALGELVAGFSLSDSWTQHVLYPSFTYYHASGASRLDRLYLSPGLMALKSGTRMVPVAFSDHCAVELRLRLPAYAPPTRQRFWTLYPDVLRDVEIRRKLILEWATWRQRRRYYPTVALWWERCVLRRLRLFIGKEMAERRADHRAMEDHLHECIYDILHGAASHGEKLSNLNRYKAKLIRHHAKRPTWVRLDQREGDVFPDERLSMFHLLRQRKRHRQKVVQRLQDEDGVERTDDHEICEGFATYYAQHFDSLNADPECVARLVQELRAGTGVEQERGHMDLPITESELFDALRKGAPNKAPGVDGVGLEFYRLFWDTIKTDLLDLMNFMFLHQGMTSRQNHGILINLPKGARAATPADYRPITLLTVEYKLLARIMAARIRPLLRDVIGRTQFCGVPGKTILDAVAQIRDAIGYSDAARRPLCVVSLDFRQAFDRISHQYLHAILPAYGVPPLFCERVRSLYRTATAAVRVNGHLSHVFPVRCGVRQGCPLSMALFGLAVHPLLASLERRLPGLFVGGERAIPPVLAYADDVTVLLEEPVGLEVLYGEIQLFEKATGASLNANKSAVMPLRSWTAGAALRDIPVREEVGILGIRFGTTVAAAARLTWNVTVNAVRATAWRTRHRHLSMSERILFVRRYLLAKIWYVAQVLPPSTTDVRRLEAIAWWFIKNGAIFCVPLTTLQLPHLSGGWGLDVVGVKCAALLYGRMRSLAAEESTCTSLLMTFCNIQGPVANPPPRTRIPLALPHCRRYAIDGAYLPSRGALEPRRTYQRRLRQTLLSLERSQRPVPQMRVVRHSPEVVWDAVWANLHSMRRDSPVVSDWYVVIHDIVPTRQRLASINYVPSPGCDVCGEVDTLEHRLLVCGQGAILWRWTKGIIAALLRVSHADIPNDWVWCPQYVLWPKQRRAAVTWIVAHFVHYRLGPSYVQSLNDLRSFLRRAWRMVARCPARRGALGTYLGRLG